jgi:hypothetical protein
VLSDPECADKHQYNADTASAGKVES